MEKKNGTTEGWFMLVLLFSGMLIPAFSDLWDSTHRHMEIQTPGVAAVKSEPVVSVTDEEIGAAAMHLMQCGLSKSNRFSDLTAWLGDVTLADVEVEQTTLNNLTGWALSQEPRLKSAYLQALHGHQEAINAARQELLYHAKKITMDRYKAERAATEAKELQLAASMAGPCHSTGKK